MISKSLIFAKANLPQSEYVLFRTMFRLMEAQVPRPEVIAILNPGIDKVKKQIVERGRSYEQDMPAGYLEKVWSGYEEHYKFHRGSRVLWIDTADLDFVKNSADFEKLLTCILAPRKPGVYHVKP